MTDKDNSNDSSGPSGKRTLSLRGGAGGGRPVVSRSTRSVVVEKRTRRVVTPGSGGGPRPHGNAPAVTPTSPRRQPAPQQAAEQQISSGLTSSEAQARERALREAAARQADEQVQAQEDARRRAEEDKRREAIKADQERQRVEEEALKLQEEAQKVSSVAREKPAARAKPTEPDMPAPPPAANEDDTRARRTSAPVTPRDREAEPDDRARRSLKPAPERPVRRAGDTDGRRQGRLTINTALTENERDRGPSLAAMRRRREKQKGRSQTAAPKISREVTIPEAITVQELANRMAERSVDVIKLLMQQGQMVKINDVLDADTAELIASEMGHSVKRVAESDVEEGFIEDFEKIDASEMAPRPPVVTIMGHVDHGKTSLLDALRHANVVAGEAGGITQHIGAYQVDVNGQPITFLDTPGHEAFTSMRARGANATDIAILVVAADDGVMPQTIESIKHAKAAGVPIIVAINKIDRPDAEPNRVRTELLQHEVFVESMGGETLDVEVSAKNKTNLEKLLETILLQAEVLELKAKAKGAASGIVVEAKLDKGRGAVATVLVQNGELEVGDIVVAGGQWARVRALINDKGEQIKVAPPSTPVEVLGFTGVPEAGDKFGVVENEARAREITEYRQRRDREGTGVPSVTSLEQMMSQLKTADVARFPLVIKGDVQGSVEAIVNALDKLGTDEVSAQILTSAVGGITESDVTLAKASEAIIIGFNVRANKQARELAEREGIEIRYYNVIYDLVDDVKQAMSGMLAPEIRETFIGYAEVLEVFNISKVGKVAGCRVTEGLVERGSGVRLLRDDVVIHEGKLSTLKRFKDEVKDVPAGQECGMAFENYHDMRPGDVIECFRVEQVTRTL
ncbi:MAG: translation initiation factor IF-2 [Hyphomicrobiaceae bacterium]|nr:translation initiation factor IF-2 [Hyphomicrobiaceae bacterium]